MAGPKIKGGHVGSIASLKKRLKKGGGGQYLSRVPGDGALTVRFLTEPDEWVEYFEHFDQMRKFYPCTDNCPGCLEGDKPSKRYLSNAVDTQENKVVPLVLPASAASSLVKKYDKYATLLDRDYEIARSGTGFDTEYEVTPEPPTKMNLNRFDALDLLALLQAQLEDEADDADEDDEDEKPARKPRPGTKAPAKATRKKAAPIDTDDDDDDEEEDEDEPDEPDTDDDADDTEDESDDDNYSRADLDDMSPAEVKALLKESGWSLADLKGKSKDDMIDEYLEYVGADDDGDEDAEDADTDDEDDEDDDEEELDEDALLAMDLPDLKALAKEYGVKIARGAKQTDIVAAILDQAGEDDDED